MQFSNLSVSFFSATFAVLASPIPDGSSNSGGFGLVAVHSGSSLQYAGIKYDDSHPQVFSVGGSEGVFAEFKLNDDSTLTDNITGRGVYYNTDTGEVGLVSPWGDQAASTGFSADFDLFLNGKQLFAACPSGKGYSLVYNYSCPGAIGLGLHVAKHHN